MDIAKTAITRAWDSIRGIRPDSAISSPTGQSSFRLAGVDEDRLVIATKSGKLTIRKAYFEGALAYLMANEHTANSPCLIASNKVYAKAGPLCRSARAASSGQMNITYVLPLLREVGLVGIDPGKPSKAWFIR